MSTKESLRTLAMALGADGEAKSIKGLVREIAIIEGASGEGKTVSDLIMEIAEEKSDLLAMTVDFDISDSTDLLGKYDYQLQKNMTSANGKISGTLYQVNDYTGFGNPDEQTGHFIAMHCEVPDIEGATIKFISKSGKKYIVDPSDGLIVIRITTQPTKFRFEISKSGSATVEKVFDTSGIVLSKEIGPDPKN